MQLSAKASKSGITELWIPNFFGTPVISGDNITLKELKTVEGGFKAFVEVTGTYKIIVSY
jgi:hypothetical protein